MKKKELMIKIMILGLFSIFYFVDFLIPKVIFYIGIVYFLIKYKLDDNKEISEKNHVYFDDITGLYNLKGFNKFFYLSPQNEKKYFILIDFVSLRRINSHYGREFGDKVLKAFVLRIKNIFDYESIISRYDNRKIIICFSGYEIENLEAYVKKIQKNLNESLLLDEEEISIKSSMAVLECASKEKKLDEVFYKLELILKKLEKNSKGYEIYNVDFSKKYEEKLKLEKELEKAINNKELKAYYQPQIDIKNSKLIGFEALIRWESESFGVLSPGKFIQIAEEQGLYGKFFYLILENVCQDIVELKRHIKDDFKVSINISDIDLRESENLLKYIKKFLEKYNVSGKYLELELTENFAIKTTEKNLNFFYDIKSLGISLAIDDFGIGYSSFSHLKNFPIDKIKLDREFVHEINEDKLAEKIVTSIVELSKELNVELLAEGIETGEQLTKLRELGCYKIQGYIFGKAIPCDKVISLVDEGFYQLGIDLLTKELEIEDF